MENQEIDGGRGWGLRKRRRVKREMKIMEEFFFPNVPMGKEMQTAREHLMGTLSVPFSSKEEHGCFSFLASIRRDFHLLIAPLGFNQS